MYKRLEIKERRRVLTLDGYMDIQEGDSLKITYRECKLLDGTIEYYNLLTPLEDPIPNPKRFKFIGVGYVHKINDIICDGEEKYKFYRRL